MKGTFTLSLTLLTLIIKTSAFYLNMGHFLKPILSPQQDTYGSAIKEKTSKGTFENTITYFDSHIKKHNHQYGINRFRKGIKQNLRTEQDVEDDLYKAIGIPEQIIYTRVLPIHMNALRDLYAYFPKHRITKKNLMESMKRLKELIEWVTQHYLKEINTIVLGNNNDIKGQYIYVKGNNLTIRGTDFFIFNANYENRPITGNNIVRIGAFDVDLDLIDSIKRHPQTAITFLEYY